MTKLFTYAALISFAVFSSCSNIEMEDDKEVLDAIENIDETTLDVGTADFTIDNSHGLVYEEAPLLLTNNSENATTYHWDFGNDDISTEANPSYSYDMHGTYTVKLTIEDKYGNIEESSHDITVMCLFAGNIHKDF